MWDLMFFPLRCMDKQTSGYFIHEASALSRVRSPVSQFGYRTLLSLHSCSQGVIDAWSRWRPTAARGLRGSAAVRTSQAATHALYRGRPRVDRHLGCGGSLFWAGLARARVPGGIKGV